MEGGHKFLVFAHHQTVLDALSAALTNKVHQEAFCVYEQIQENYEFNMIDEVFICGEEAVFVVDCDCYLLKHGLKCYFEDCLKLHLGLIMKACFHSKRRWSGSRVISQYGIKWT